MEGSQLKQGGRQAAGGPPYNLSLGCRPLPPRGRPDGMSEVTGVWDGLSFCPLPCSRQAEASVHPPGEQGPRALPGIARARFTQTQDAAE